MEIIMAIRQRATSLSAAHKRAALKAAASKTNLQKSTANKTSEVKALQAWYSSDEAKRSLGFICQAVNELGETVNLLGSPEEPQLQMIDIDLYDGEYDEISTVDEVRANWTAVTLAAAIMGTRFRIDGRKRPRAALISNPSFPHPALRFKRPQSPETRALAERLEEVLNEIRRLDNRIGMPWTSSEASDLAALADRMETSADVMMRNYRRDWRDASGYPIG